MKLYIALMTLLIFSLFGFAASQCYAADNKSNSFSYTNKNCNNDKCSVIHCDNSHPCSKAETSNSTTNSPKLSTNTLSEKKLDVMNMVKKLLNFN